MVSRDGKKTRALVIYYSETGNTMKVAEATHDGLLGEKVDSMLCTVQRGAGKEF